MAKPNEWLKLVRMVTAGLITAGLTALQACTAPPASPTPAPSITQAATPTPTSTWTETLEPTPTASPTLNPETPTPTPSPTLTPQADGPLKLVQTIEFQPWALVHAAAWSPDGEALAVSAGETVYIYRFPGLETLQRLDVQAWAASLAFAPAHHGEIFALAGRDGTVQIWDYAQGIQLARFFAHNKGANSLDFSPDGSRLASSGNDAIVRLWDMAAFYAEPQAEIPTAAEMIGGAFAVPSIRFSPDGSLVASVDLEAIRLRDPSTQRLVRTLRGEASIFAIEFSPDGRFLAAAEEALTLRIWDVTSGETVTAWQAPGQASKFLWNAVFSPDGQRIGAVGSNGWVYLFAINGDLLAALPAHSRAASAIAYSPDEQWLVTGGLDGRLLVWQISP